MAIADQPERGRPSFADREWASSYAALTEAGVGQEVGADDLEDLATAAVLLGRDAEGCDVFGRAHSAYLLAGDPERAAKCAERAHDGDLVVLARLGLGQAYLARGEADRGRAHRTTSARRSSPGGSRIGASRTGSAGPAAPPELARGRDHRRYGARPDRRIAGALQWLRSARSARKLRWVR